MSDNDLEYLTIKELSRRLDIKPKTIKNKMASGSSGRVSTISALRGWAHVSNGARSWHGSKATRINKDPAFQ